MDVLEIESVLRSFCIIHDSREHRTDRARRRYNAFDCPHSSGTLSFGDYCYDAVLPNGSHIVDVSEIINAPCVVERKMSLSELEGNFTRGRKRFEREFQKAKDFGSRVFLLVEDGSIDKILSHDYPEKFHPNAYLSSLTSWMVRYNAQVVFCKRNNSGRMIRELLYRDLKERLENGEFG